MMMKRTLVAALGIIAAHRGIVNAVLLSTVTPVGGRTLPRESRPRPSYKESTWGRFDALILPNV
jgi:hypothetical protein